MNHEVLLSKVFIFTHEQLLRSERAVYVSHVE